jgi:hypothetical protein
VIRAKIQSFITSKFVSYACAYFLPWTSKDFIYTCLPGVDTIRVTSGTIRIYMYFEVEDFWNE